MAPRAVVNAGEERLRIAALVANDRGPRRHVATDDVGVHFGVELDGVQARAQSVRSRRVERRRRQHFGPGREAHHRVDVRLVNVERAGQPGKEGTVSDAREANRANLATERIPPDFTAERLREHLMSETDAQDGRSCVGDLPQELFDAQHPGRALRHAGA